MYAVHAFACTHLGQSKTPDTFYPFQTAALEQDLLLSSTLTFLGKSPPVLWLQLHTAMPTSFLHGAEASHSDPQAVLAEPCSSSLCQPADPYGAVVQLVGFSLPLLQLGFSSVFLYLCWNPFPCPMLNFLLHSLVRVL